MEIILDTNFIITAIKQKAQLFEQLEELFPNCKILIPIQVIEELEKIPNSKQEKLIDRESASLALQIIKKKSVQNIEFTAKNVDAGIVRYTKEKKDLIIATLDKQLKQKIKDKNPKVQFLTIKEKKRISLQ